MLSRPDHILSSQNPLCQLLLLLAEGCLGLGELGYHRVCLSQTCSHLGVELCSKFLHQV